MARRYRVAVTIEGEVEPFWRSGWHDAKTTERIRARNAFLIERKKWKHVVTVEEES